MQLIYDILDAMNNGPIDRDHIQHRPTLCELRPGPRKRAMCVPSPFPSPVSVFNLFSVFWEQQGLQTFGHRIQITRPHASQPAFERHLLQLMEEYGAIHAINLMGQKENEAALSNAYAHHLARARNALGDDLGITHFDFHNQVRIGGHDSVMRELMCEAILCLLEHID